MKDSFNASQVLVLPSGFPSNPKIAFLSPDDKWHLIELMCLAAESGGRIYASNEQIAVACGMPLGDWLKFREALMAIGLISAGKDGTICITMYEDQFDMFASGGSQKGEASEAKARARAQGKERQRRYRERRKKGSSGQSTSQEGARTTDSLSRTTLTLTENRNANKALRNASVTLLDNDLQSPLVEQDTEENGGRLTKNRNANKALRNASVTLFDAGDADLQNPLVEQDTEENGGRLTKNRNASVTLFDAGDARQGKDGSGSSGILTLTENRNANKALRNASVTLPDNDLQNPLVEQDTEENGGRLTKNRNANKALRNASVTLFDAGDADLQNPLVEQDTDENGGRLTKNRNASVTLFDAGDARQGKDGSGSSGRREYSTTGKLVQPFRAPLLNNVKSSSFDSDIYIFNINICIIYLYNNINIYIIYLYYYINIIIIYYYYIIRARVLLNNSRSIARVCTPACARECERDCRGSAALASESKAEIVPVDPGAGGVSGSSPDAEEDPAFDPTAPLTAEEINEWMRVHDENRPQSWPGASISLFDGPQVRSLIQDLRRAFKGQKRAISEYALALATVRVHPDLDWWRKRAITHKVFMERERIAEWASLGRQIGLDARAVADSGLSDKQIEDGMQKMEKKAKAADMQALADSML